ncbi:MAG: gliding motility-associated protein GldE [Ekhidna sp.]|nr:gliding motility-associated protein GldE [Ekhidna sp.]MBC6425397.1 gliding motility-associated protein GldE [Ekhidna sp.]
MEVPPEDSLPFHLLATVASEPSFFIAVGLIVLGLLFLSGLISGSEVAFFSLTHNQMRDFNVSDDLNEKRIAKLLHHPKRLLATILILNNLVNIFIITISTYTAWQIVGDQGEEGIVIASLTTIITALIIFFGEIIPKVYANHNSISFAKVTSGLLMFSYGFLKPVSWFLMSVNNLIEQRVKKKGYNLSVEEINQALEISVEKEEVTEEEKGILKGIVNFGTLSVKQVMKSRMDITAYDKETDFHELMNQINKNGYSRIPVFSETIDKIEGILYIKDLLPHIDKGENFNWQKLLRPAFFIPESKKIDDLFKDFQEKQVHIAVVIDEYGGTSGLITMEDVIEEIVGEINDEFDDDRDIAYNKLDNNTYIFEGKTSLNDFCKITHSDITTFDRVKGESESLGGLVLELNSKLPGAGEKITYQNFVFTVVAVDLRRIKRLRVHIKPEKSNAGKFED